VVVEGGRDRVEPHAMGREEPGGGIGLSGAEDHLARQEDLAAAQHPDTRERPLGVRRVVSAPRGVDPPDLAVPEAETRRPGCDEERGVGAGAPAAALAQVCPDREALSLRSPLAEMAAGEVEQLVGLVRHRQHEPHGVDGVGGGRVGVGEGGPCAHDAAAVDLDDALQGEADRGVRSPDDQPVARVGPLLDRVLHQLEVRREGPAGAVPLQAGAAGPPGRLLGQQGGGPVPPGESVGAVLRLAQHRQQRVGRGGCAEPCAPVQHAGYATRHVDHDGGVTPVQHDGRVGRGARRYDHALPSRRLVS
jgi:hypothetical protein